MWEGILATQAARLDLRNEGRYRSGYHLEELYFALLEIAQPGLFVEAGAFDATASRRAAALLPGARVIAAEANPNNHAIWTRQVDFAAQGVDYRQVALADGVSEVSFILRSTGDAEVAEDNSILPLTGARQVESADAVTVPATTLDALLTEVAAGVRVAAWVDVEGANREVLTGGATLLGRVDLIKIEVETQEMWSGQWLAVDVLENLLGHGLVPVARDAQAPTQFNLVCVSERVLACPGAAVLIDDFLRAQGARELPGALGLARRDPRVRAAARSVSALARRVR